jgi:hypothetical protein
MLSCRFRVASSSWKSYEAIVSANKWRHGGRMNDMPRVTWPSPSILHPYPLRAFVDELLHSPKHGYVFHLACFSSAASPTRCSAQSAGPATPNEHVGLRKDPHV